MKIRRCPKCGSTNVKLGEYQGIEVVICPMCGFDESRIYDEFPEMRTSQKAKAQFTPYKAGGGRRTSKK